MDNKTCEDLRAQIKAKCRPLETPDRFANVVDTMNDTELQAAIHYINKQSGDLHPSVHKCPVCQQDRWSAMYWPNSHWSTCSWSTLYWYGYLCRYVCSRCSADACGCSKQVNRDFLQKCSVCNQNRCTKHGYDRNRVVCNVCIETMEWGKAIRESLIQMSPRQRDDMSWNQFKRILLSQLEDSKS